MKVKVTPSKVHGNVKIPASKSMAHRALICASLSDGTSIVSNVTNSKDIEATVGCMKALGAKIKQIDETIRFYFTFLDSTCCMYKCQS